MLVAEVVGVVGDAIAGGLEIGLRHGWSFFIKLHDALFDVFVIKVVKHTIRSKDDDIVILDLMLEVISGIWQLWVGSTLIWEVETVLL